MIDIRLPNINATTEAGQIAQMRSYLYQFAEQLKWALNTLETNPNGENVELRDAVGNVLAKTEEAKAQETFNSIKDLIIKSADIVEAYSEEMNDLLDLDGRYVAQTAFGKYTEETNQKISANTDGVKQSLSRVENIDGRLRKQEGSIRYGNVKTYLTSDGTTIGIEVGEIDTINDVATSRYATFSAAGIELYDGSTDRPPVATISKEKITITSAEFKERVKMGGYRLDLTKGIAFKWEGV